MPEKIPGIHFPEKVIRQNVHEAFNRALTRLQSADESVSPILVERLEDDTFFEALPEHIRSSEKELAEYLLHSGKFNDIVYRERQKVWDGDATGLFGAEENAAEMKLHDGRQRRAENGYKINIDYLQTIGINPSKVLFFRVTQPSTTPKPELYWTSDLTETQRGLTAEISNELRKKAIILVADLETINKNGGLIQDVNDDEGLSVRQIGSDNFNQQQCLAVIKPKG